MKSSLEGLFIDYIPQGFARTPVLIRQSSDIAYDVSKFQGLELLEMTWLCLLTLSQRLEQLMVQLAL